MYPEKNGGGVAAEGASAAGGYGYQKDFHTALPQIVAVSVKNLLLLAYGMTLGFPTILIPAVINPSEGETLKLNPSEVSWIGSLNLMVVPLGCAVSGAVTAPLGRRRAMQLVNLPFFAAWVLLHFAQTSSHLFAALCLTGLAGGLLEAPVLTYVAEVTQPHLRGALTATSSMCIIIGVFTQFLFGLIFHWRTVVLVNTAFTVISIVTLCFVPESPHWLISRNRFDDARKSLQWLRGWTTPMKVEGELRDICKLFKKKDGSEGRTPILEALKEYTKRGFLVPYCLVGYAFFVGHFCGMTSLQTYAVRIFQALRSPFDEYYATLVLGLVQILGSLTCVALVHTTGKRPLTFFSLAGTTLCCLVVALYDYYIRCIHNNDSEPRAELGVAGVGNWSHSNATELKVNADEFAPYSWVPMTALILLAGLSHTGIRLLPWILIGEVFSTKTRSGASGLSSAIGYIFAFLSNKFFINMLHTMSITGTYGLYALISITGAVVFYFILPETEGKKLEEIENHFAGIQRLSNEVYRSKRKTDPDDCLKNDAKPRVNPAFEMEISKL